jgi:hypothetical protein
MGQLSFAVGKPAAAVSYGQNVVPFNTGRRRSPVRLYPTAQTRLSEVVVVRLPKAPRTDETISKGRAKSSDSDEMRLTSFDFVAVAFLILSVFTGPALVWSLLRAASLG